MRPESLLERFQELQQYVNWTQEDAERVRLASPILECAVPALVEDFYQEIARHPRTSSFLQGGIAQIEHLKGTLANWLRELLRGPYDDSYVRRRWRVGVRHVEIGLDQVYANVGLSRLRRGMLAALEAGWRGDQRTLDAVRHSLLTLLDLDLALIADAYQSEYGQRLQRHERLAALGQVAGGIAHELRNPLNVIKTSVYFLTRALVPPPEKQWEHLDRIKRHVQIADSAITALTDFSRLPLPRLESFALKQCLQSTLEILPSRSDIRIHLQCPELQTLADADQMRLVFGNIIRNGLEAMPQGGTLTITAQHRGTHVEVEVTDTGVGMSAEQLALMSEPLYSTKARGLGLGLAIVRSILEKNQSSFRVVSQPGKGSTFTVVLPADARSSLRPSPP